MATYDLAVGGAVGVSEQSARKHILFANSINFATQNILSTDVAQILNIPANFLMTHFGVRLDTAEGGVATATFGDGADPNGWMATAFDMNGAVDTFANALETDAYCLLGGKYYAVADTIDMIASATLDVAVLTCWAQGFLLNDTYIVPSASLSA